MKLTTTLGVDFHTTSKSFPRVQIELYTPALPLLESSTNPILDGFCNKPLQECASFTIHETNALCSGDIIYGRRGFDEMYLWSR